MRPRLSSSAACRVLTVLLRDYKYLLFITCSIFERSVIFNCGREQRQIFLKIQIISRILSGKIVNKGVGSLSAAEEE